MSGTSIFAYLILILIIGYTLIYPSMGDLSLLMDQKEKHNETLEVVKDIETKKKELLSEYNSIPDTDKENINIILPSSQNFVRLVSQIDSVAAGHGISIDGISSRESSSSSGGSISESQEPEIYKSSIVSFHFVASYDKFTAFMGDLEESLRILDLRSMSLDTQEGGFYSYHVEFEIYWIE